MSRVLAFVAGTIVGWCAHRSRSGRWTAADDLAVHAYSTTWRVLP
jgi:hypothetical protein